MKVRFRALLAVLFAVLSLFLTLALKAYAEPIVAREGDCTYELSDDGVLSISPTNGEIGTISRVGSLDGINSDDILAIVINGHVYAPEDSSGLFGQLHNVSSISLT